MSAHTSHCVRQMGSGTRAPSVACLNSNTRHQAIDLLSKSWVVRNTEHAPKLPGEKVVDFVSPPGPLKIVERLS